MRRARADTGQTSLDFIAGMAIFLFTFMFVFSFIPDLLTPFASSSDELTMTADRVGITLVQNVLVDNGGNMSNVVNTTRLNKMMTDLDPGSANYKLTREKLGLSGTVRLYDINVTIETIGGLKQSSGPAFPESAGNVGQSRRMAIVSPDGTETMNVTIITVRVW